MSRLPVVHSMFETDALSSVIARRYDIGPLSSFELYRSYVNDVYRVETRRGATCFLKIARRTWRTREDVAWGVALQQHLQQHHVPASVPILQRDGEAVCLLDAPEGARAAVLYAETPGVKPGPPFTALLYEAVGKATARMHSSLDHFGLPSPRPGRSVSWLIERSGAVVTASLHSADADRAFIKQFSERLAADVHARSSALDWGICHGDLTLDNLTVDRDDTITFFDFDLAAPAWRASEPSGIYTWAVDDATVWPLWEAFLTGYRTERTFSTHDEAAVPHFAAAYELWDLAHEIERWQQWSGLWRTTPQIVAERIARLRVWAHRLGLSVS